MTVPSPRQGLAALAALNILEVDESTGSHPWGSAEHLHASIEAMRYAYSDALAYCADPECVDVNVAGLLSKSYAEHRRAELFRPNKARLRHAQPYHHVCIVVLSCQEACGKSCGKCQKGSQTQAIMGCVASTGCKFAFC